MVRTLVHEFLVSEIRPHSMTGSARVTRATFWARICGKTPARDAMSSHTPVCPAPTYTHSHVHQSAIDREQGEFALLPTFRLPTLIHTRSTLAVSQ